MRRSLLNFSLACFATVSTSLCIAQTQTGWVVTGSDSHNYQVQGFGDPANKLGATVTLTAAHADPDKFGGSLTFVDAAPYRGHTIMLSADLDTRDAIRGAAIWLRADGPQGNVAFANSQMMPVAGTTTAHREVRINVPAVATKLVFGTTLSGNGQVLARNLRLTNDAPSSAKHVAPDVVLDAAIRVVRSRALRTHDVDWAKVEPQIRAMAKDAKESRDVYPAIHALLKALGDHHSFFMEPWASQQFSVNGGPTSISSVTLKADGIGYINMPGYAGMQAAARRAFITDMVNAIANIAPQARHGWIVDLRHDTGGSMLPMLAGLRPLLGGEPLGSFRDNGNKLSTFSADSPLDNNLPTGPDLQHVPVAVITGPHTASSGEVVVIAFRGRSATRSFGLPTAGLSTGNTVFPLPDGSSFALTTADELDRTGRAYGNSIPPDETIASSTSAVQRTSGSTSPKQHPQQSSPADDEDPAIAAAASWLKHQSPGAS